MPEVVSWKSLKKIHIRDGLGICRLCIYFDQSPYTETVQVGTEEYFDAPCLKKNMPCYLTRKTLLTCTNFKSLPTLKKTSFISRLIKFFTKK